MIRVITFDHQALEVPETVFKQFTSFSVEASLDRVSLQVTRSVLEKVIDYCKNHVEEDEADDDKIQEKNKWDKNFVNVDQALLYDLMEAANYLGLKGLVLLTCKKVAEMIKGKNPEEIRQALHIQDDLTADELEKICREDQWAYKL